MGALAIFTEEGVAGEVLSFPDPDFGTIGVTSRYRRLSTLDSALLLPIGDYCEKVWSIRARS
jgi:hypothetical protein